MSGHFIDFIRIQQTHPVGFQADGTFRERLPVVEDGIVYARSVGATTIVYGCTHYPLLHPLFLESQEKLGWRGEFIDPAIYVAEDVKKWNLKGEKKFYPHASKDTPAFINNIIKLL